MISSDGCRQLVAGSYDVLINEPSSCKSVLRDFLEHFKHHENELGQSDCSYLREFKMLKEFSKTLKENKANLEEGESEFNQKKNRYKDIIPFSHTRVILSGNPQLEPGSNYINANYIRGPSGSPRAYIACQGPLPCTLVDFWRMIWECDVSVIIMACNELESGKPKCELYWPDEVETSCTYGNIQVTLMRCRQINTDFLIRKFSIKLLDPIKSYKQTTQQPNVNINNHSQTLIHQQNQLPNNINNFRNASNHLHHPDNKTSINGTNCMNNYQSNDNQYVEHSNGNSVGNSSTSDESSINTDTELQNNNHLNGNIISNNHAHQSNQPHSHHEGDSLSDVDMDHHKTNNITQRTVLMERTICQFHYTTWPDHGAPPSVHPILELVRLVREVQPAEDRPILVHCSAGCGRTGTICCIDYVWGLMRRGKLDSSFDLYSLISEMREQRMAMVQTLEQYILCHRAVAALFMQQLQLIDDDDEDATSYKEGDEDDHDEEEEDGDGAVDDSYDDQDTEPIFI